MLIGRIMGATRTLGKSQGYLGLPVRDEVTEAGEALMATAWLPTPAEIIAINRGAPIIVRILGTQHPPILLETGEVPG